MDKGLSPLEAVLCVILTRARECRMKLANRLDLIRSMLMPGNCLLDVGTDHALIPVAAIQDGLFSRAIATDIRPGPLERAARTVKRYALEGRIDLRLGPGFAPVQAGECDVVVLAGMGALMITGILAAHPSVSMRAKQLLLQPMHAQERLRPWLRDNQYEILDERLAQEGDRRYQVIAVRHAGASRTADCGVPERSSLGRDVLDRVGERTLQPGNPLTIAWVEDWRTRQLRIVEGLRKAGNRETLADAERLLTGLDACLEWLDAREREGRDRHE